MQRKLYKITIHTLIFIAFATFMPGFVVANGPVGKIIAGIGYTIMFMVIDDVLHFFKLPKTTTFRFAGGLLIIMAYLYFLVSQFPKFLIIGKSYIGNIDFILFKIPTTIPLEQGLPVFVASALILLLCSIMMEKLRK